MHYNWQIDGWPCFTYGITSSCQEKLDTFEQNKQRIQKLAPHKLASLNETLLGLRVIEAQKTFEMEGSIIAPPELKLAMQTPIKEDRTHSQTQNIAAFMADLERSFQKPLNESMLHQWHKYLVANNAGVWRHDNATVTIGLKKRILFKAPPAEQISSQIKTFINWFNAPSTEPAPIKAAIAYLYFKSIYPYSHCNGPVARALVEKILSNDMGFYVPSSLSYMLIKHIKSYNKLLRDSQISLNITLWIEFFVNKLCESQARAQKQIQYILYKNEFWTKHYHQLSNRQLVALNKMITKGPDGIEGGMGARMYMQVTCCAKSTASRDLTDLVNKKCIQAHGLSSATYYTLAFLSPEYLDESL